MQTTRRTLITGAGASLGLAGLATPGRPWAAPAFAQDIEISALSDLKGSDSSDEEGFCPTGLDLNISSPTATLIWSLLERGKGVASFGMAEDQLAYAMRQAAPASYRLRSLVAQDSAHYCAVFERGGQPPPVRYHLRQTAAQYQAMVAASAREGLEPVQVSVDNHDGAPRFTTVLRRSTTAWEARHAVKPAELNALTAAMKARGLRPARLAPYLDGGQKRFLTLYRPIGPHAWQTWTMSNADFSKRVPQYLNEGYVLLQAIGWAVDGDTVWSTVWQRPVGAPRDYFWGL